MQLLDKHKGIRPGGKRAAGDRERLSAIGGKLQAVGAGATVTGVTLVRRWSTPPTRRAASIR